MRVIEHIGRFTLGRVYNGYIVINSELDYSHHSHFMCESAARKCIKLIERKLVPKGRYFKEAIIRLIGLEEYSTFVERKKEKYINVNKGCRQRA